MYVNLDVLFSSNVLADSMAPLYQDTAEELNAFIKLPVLSVLGYAKLSADDDVNKNFSKESNHFFKSFIFSNCNSDSFLADTEPVHSEPLVNKSYRDSY